MRTALLFAAAAATALSLAACQKQRDQTADATNAMSTSEPVNAAQDATSAAVGQAAASVGANTTEGFVKNAAISDMYEIRAGQIAQQKGQTPAVKAFGKQMVTDHTAMSNEMKPLITAANQTAPTELDERHKGLIDNLNAASPADFDKVYLSQQEAAHQEALTLLKGYADGGDDAGLKGAASKAIPKVQAHLDKVHELQAAAPAPASK